MTKSRIRQGEESISSFVRGSNEPTLNTRQCQLVLVHTPYNGNGSGADMGMPHAMTPPPEINQSTLHLQLFASNLTETNKKCSKCV